VIKLRPFYEIRKADLTVKHNNYEVNFPSHFHKYIELLYVYDGVQHIRIDDTNYCVNKGELAVIFPDIVHSYFKGGEKKADELLIMCAPSLLGSLFPNLKNYKPSNPIVSKENINEEVFFALNHLSPESNFEVKFGYICIILSKIVNSLILNNKIKTPFYDITHKITEYIEQNFTENITRESLAKTFNVDIYYISRIFTNNFKMNLRSYLGIIRSEYAAFLIRTTNRTITDIALGSGFESIRTFNRVFKDIYGISPTQFKNNLENFSNKSLKIK